jgi:NAD(P)-dependent dehydrogenase (short-subunit alcohol dehydrogenase family)
MSDQPDGRVDFSLDGKVAFVTGASRGIGKAIAITLAQYGADVAVAARTVEALEQTKKEVEAAGQRGLVVPCDVTDSTQVEEAIEKTIGELGGLEVVVNNAGGSRFMSPLIGVREEGWDKAINVNLKSAYLVCKAVGPHLLDQQKGSVINISSVAGVHGSPTLSFYSAAKFGMIGLTRTLAREWASLGVRVNAISPGAVDTEIWGSLAEDKNFVEMSMQGIPMGRWAKPEEIAAAAVFLASDASPFMTGANIIIDGGATA